MNAIDSIQDPISLLEHFSIIEDPRMDRHKKYPLINILAYAFVSILSDQQSWYEIEAFSTVNLEWFGQYFDVSCGVPSHDTFRRVFSLLDPVELEKIIIRWTEELRRKYHNPRPRVVALDGKALKGVPWKLNLEKLYTLNAWDATEGCFIGQATIGEKTNEITAAPKLLRLLKLANTTITTDALLTQKEIAKTIIEKKGDYVMALKGNQGNLYDEVRLYFTKTSDQLEQAEKIEKNRGVVEIRRCKIAQAEWNEDSEKWIGLKTFISLELESHYEGKLKKETRYYLSSLNQKAEEFLKIIRLHWNIENHLHRSLDVYFKEDESQEHNRNAASNLSVLRKVALSLLKAIDPKKKLKLKLKEAAYSSNFRERCLIGKF